MSYDVIVIGARCAGTSTAMLLARQGRRVLLVDRGVLPSDFALSTHLIHPAGTMQLAEWGLLEPVRSSGCPPLDSYFLDFGAFTLEGVPAESAGIPAFGPRRLVLDQILLEGAVAAGVEVRDQTCLSELMWENDRAAGVRLIRADGTVADERASLVIGADGRHSTLAKLVAAPLADYRPALQGTYFGYFRDVPTRNRVEIHLRDGRIVYTWPTSDELTLIGVNWPLATYGQVRQDPGRHVADALEEDAPDLAERVECGTRVGRWIGTADTPTFTRRSHGPGWALVGDAAHAVDPCTAQGISDAFGDALSLSTAIHQGWRGSQHLDEELADHERRRAAATKPMSDLTYQLSALGPLPVELQAVFGALVGHQAHTDRLLGVLAGTVTVESFFDPASVAELMTARRGDGSEDGAGGV